MVTAAQIIVRPHIDLKRSLTTRKAKTVRLGITFTVILTDFLQFE